MSEQSTVIFKLEFEPKVEINCWFNEVPGILQVWSHIQCSNVHEEIVAVTSSVEEKAKHGEIT